MTRADSRPDLVQRGRKKLSRTEALQIRAIRSTFDSNRLDRAVRWCQHRFGARWITHVTSNLREVHGLDRLPPLDPKKSYLCVSNHRSFFDHYVTTGHLLDEGRLDHHRIVFPVRSEFFYDTPLGFFVNGTMSFFAMYPPIFRERSRMALNLMSLDELAWMLKKGGMWAGIHPEGTRNKGDDPYSFLPAQSGVGRVIHQSRTPVVPVFTNGLLQENLPKQIRSNWDGTGRRVIIVIGAPIDFGDLLDRPGSPRVYKQIAEKTLDVVGALGREERAIRESTSTVLG